MTSFFRSINTALVLLAATAAPAAAQYTAPSMSPAGKESTDSRSPENYHIEFSAAYWNPTVSGIVASSQFGIAGTQIDFVKDLKFQQTRFREFRAELKAGHRNKLYMQYTPIMYTSDTTLSRDVIFNGQNFAVNLPIQAAHEWKVLRLGYEGDIIANDKGFLGVLIEGRMTQFSASLKAPSTTEFTKATGPLPAVGLTGRGYIIPQLSITGSVTGFKAAYQDNNGSYFDWDFYGTYNVGRYLGVQMGWRKINNNVTLKNDYGNTAFKGIWFGAAVRY